MKATNAFLISYVTNILVNNGYTLEMLPQGHIGHLIPTSANRRVFLSRGVSPIDHPLSAVGGYMVPTGSLSVVGATEIGAVKTLIASLTIRIAELESAAQEALSIASPASIIRRAVIRTIGGPITELGGQNYPTVSHAFLEYGLVIIT